LNYTAEEKNEPLYSGPLKPNCRTLGSNAGRFTGGKDAWVPESSEVFRGGRRRGKVFALGYVPTKGQEKKKEKKPSLRFRTRVLLPREKERNLHDGGPDLRKKRKERLSLAYAEKGCTSATLRGPKEEKIGLLRPSFSRRKKCVGEIKKLSLSDEERYPLHSRNEEAKKTAGLRQAHHVIREKRSALLGKAKPLGVHVQHDRIQLAPGERGKAARTSLKKKAGGHLECK